LEFNLAYADLNSIHNPATGTIAPAAWGDQARDNFEFLIDPPACSVHSIGTPQSLTSNVLTALTAPNENFDNDAMHSTVSNTSRITGQTAGRYLFIANVSFAANATGGRLLDMAVNGATLTGSGMQFTSTGAGTPINLTYARMITLAVGDYVEARARQVSGGALNVELIEFGATFMTR
jgi:hypothetical protein